MPIKIKMNGWANMEFLSSLDFLVTFLSRKIEDSRMPLKININGWAIRFNVATAEKFLNTSSVLTEINFKMRKLLLKV